MIQDNILVEGFNVVNPSTLIQNSATQKVTSLFIPVASLTMSDDQGVAGCLTK